MRKSLALLILCLLTSCGFHLRGSGQGTIILPFKTLQIVTNGNPETDFTRLLKIRLQYSGITVSPNNTDRHPGPLLRHPGPLLRHPGPLLRHPGPLLRHPGESRDPGKPVLDPAVKPRDDVFRVVGPLTLEILDDSVHQELSAAGANPELRNFTLIYGVSYRVIDKENHILLPPEKIQAVRHYSINPNQLLGSTNEEHVLKLEMAQELTEKMWYRLARITPR